MFYINYQRMVVCKICLSATAHSRKNPTQFATAHPLYTVQCGCDSNFSRSRQWGFSFETTFPPANKIWEYFGDADSPSRLAVLVHTSDLQQYENVVRQYYVRLALLIYGTFSLMSCKGFLMNASPVFTRRSIKYTRSKS